MLSCYERSSEEYTEVCCGTRGHFIFQHHPLHTIHGQFQCIGWVSFTLCSLKINLMSSMLSGLLCIISLSHTQLIFIPNQYPFMAPKQFTVIENLFVKNFNQALSEREAKNIVHAYRTYIIIDT